MQAKHSWHLLQLVHLIEAVKCNCYLLDDEGKRVRQAPTYLVQQHHAQLPFQTDADVDADAVKS